METVNQNPSRRELQKLRTSHSKATVNLSGLQSTLLRKRYGNVTVSELVEKALEEIVNLQVDKERKTLKI